ncbi:hypothetical protein B5M47_02820 [candidate division CPR3 bacterium 4484_211]|uniref:Uncharacterized protein n=1 Tax=candidate division CPR3 bacterium 4484_211 TaxID=1968527 RepID=A0A1W9NXP9_UNCC3|nr:MAG: hypothetical protein B5M47_02820 [candidate division CPR3 bacterium 4484_211]
MTNLDLKDKIAKSPASYCASFRSADFLAEKLHHSGEEENSCRIFPNSSLCSELLLTRYVIFNFTFKNKKAPSQKIYIQNLWLGHNSSD